MIKNFHPQITPMTQIISFFNRRNLRNLRTNFFIAFPPEDSI